MTIPTFSNDGVGYDAYAKLMARRVAEADDRNYYKAMRGNPIEVMPTPEEEAAEWEIPLVDKLSQTDWLG